MTITFPDRRNVVHLVARQGRRPLIFLFDKLFPSWKRADDMRGMTRSGLADAVFFASAITSRVSEWLIGPACVRNEVSRSNDKFPTPRDGDCDESSAEVLQFPVHGQAVIVELANRLRRRLHGQGASEGQLLLTLSPSPDIRLRLDASTYVEFVPASAKYRLAVQMAPDSSLVLETTQLDTVAEFAIQYVDGALAAQQAFGRAS